jgi:deoxyribose-phosphate aldolase
MNIPEYIDHTILKPSTTLAAIEQLCSEAIQYKFNAVCVPPYYVKAAKQILMGSGVLVATVIGFPLGYSSTESKIAEINQALKDGADEIDFVHNIAALKSNNWEYLAKEIALCLQPIRLAQKSIKVIIESGILTDKEIETSCLLYAKHRVDFVKTSTGFAEKGASLEAVTLMRKTLPENIKIKASGGIRNYEAAKAYIEAGVERIGTSSGIQIIKEAQKA